MFITNEERELRKNLRLKLEEIADRNKLFDNHGNEIKAIHITDIMRLLENTEILELQKDIQKLATNRMKLITDSAITPDNTVMETFAKCRGLGITNFAYTQSLEDLKHEEIEKYCDECGEEEDFTYIRTTASSFVDKGTNHYKCNNCGAELSFVENI